MVVEQVVHCGAIIYPLSSIYTAGRAVAGHIQSCPSGRNADTHLDTTSQAVVIERTFAATSAARAWRGKIIQTDRCPSP